MTAILEPTDHTADDIQLMRRLQQRDSSALQELYERHCGILTSVIYRVLNDSAETEDVLQEVLMQVWARADTYSAKKGKPLSWLTTVAKRRAIDRIRQRCAYTRATDRFKDDSESATDNETEIELTESAVERADLRNYLNGLMDSLPDAQRTALELAFFRSMSQREIAAKTETPLGTVKTRIELGLRKLTQAVGPMRQKVA
ncbi:MAG: sigma-70 family RNA polymerase sigma factor [Chthoniobacterales bacterium]